MRIEQTELRSQDGTRLYAETRWPDLPPKADVAIVHGYGDHIGRYAAFSDHLTSIGWVAHGFDYRGHGRSDGRRGYCTQFSEFHDDLSAFLEAVRSKAAGRSTFLFAHSHGGLVTTTYAEQHGLPGIAGVVLSAPWLDLGTPPPRPKLFAAKIMSKVLPTLPFPTGIGVDQLSRDTGWQEATRMDPLYGRNAPPGWFFRARAAQGQAMAEAARFGVPLVVHHGTADTIASFEQAQRFVAAAGSTDKAFVAHEGYLHELLQDRGGDAVRDQVVAWMSARATDTPNPSA